MKWTVLNLSELLAGVFFALIGVLFLFDRAGILTLSAPTIWAIALVLLGFAVLLGGRSSATRSH